MTERRMLRSALLGISLLLFLGAALFFEVRARNTCLGLPFLETAPEESQYEYRDYSADLRFFGKKAAVDVETSTVYISQDLSADTRAEDLLGKLTLEGSLGKMYFLRDPMFEDLATAAAQGHAFSLIISRGKTFMRYRLVLTTLPVLRIEDPDHTELTEKEILVHGTLCLWNPRDTDAGGYSVKKTNVRWKLRGHTAMVLPKKAYKLTLEKKSGIKRNMSLLGLGSDDDWILNPLSTDDTNVKEQFTMGLWNELAGENQWDDKMSGGDYCELILNGSYRGLYLLQRRVDRKYLNLQKDQILFKATSSDVTVPEEGTYELKYSPLPAEETYAVWQDMLQNRLAEVIDLRNYADISIFVQLGNMGDNAAFRNLYCLLTPNGEDYRLSYILWDTDMSMGMCGDFAYDFDQAVHSVILRKDYALFLTSHPELEQQIARRWFALREGILSEAHMVELLDGLDGKLNASGAPARDRERWGLYGGGQRPTQEFLHQRLAFLDDYYGGLL